MAMREPMLHQRTKESKQGRLDGAYKGKSKSWQKTDTNSKRQSNQTSEWQIASLVSLKSDSTGVPDTPLRPFRFHTVKKTSTLLQKLLLHDTHENAKRMEPAEACPPPIYPHALCLT